MKIDARLNTRSITDAINKIKWYQSDLQWKLERFVSELAEVGIKVARANTFVEYDGQTRDMSDMLEFQKPVEVTEDGVTCLLIATGRVYTKEWQGGNAQVNPLLMAEFGSGANAIEGHRGTFPNQHVAFLSSWKWKDANGVEHESSGNVPSRPMFKAKEEMEQQIRAVAERVFGTQ